MEVAGSECHTVEVLDTRGLIVCGRLAYLRRLAMSVTEGTASDLVNGDQSKCIVCIPSAVNISFA